MAEGASSSEVAAALGVSPASVQRYAREGRIPFTTTPGGHRRFDIEQVRVALQPRTRTPHALSPLGTATAVVLTALAVEFREVVALLQGATVQRHASGTRYHVGHVEGDHLQWTVAVAEIGEGNTAAAVEATRAIEFFKPSIVLFVGVAGSLKPDVAHGAVVVANKVYRYHSGKAAEDFLSRPMAFPTWHGLEQLVRVVRQQRWTAVDPQPLVELKPIAAGEVVVASKDSETFKLLHERCNDAVAVDMESAGIYEAAWRGGGLAALAVRGVSDMVADKEPNADANWQPVASKHAAEFAFALLKAADPGDLGLGPAPDPYPTEGAALMASLPPPAARVLDGALGTSPLANSIVRLLGNHESPPAERVRNGLEMLRGDPSGATEPLWVAVAEFAIAHAEHDFGSVAFEKAANNAGENAARWFARAALAAAASGDEPRAQSLLRSARDHVLDDGSGRFVEAMSAAISENVGGVLEATSMYGEGDGLIDLMRFRALAMLDRDDEALAFATRVLGDHPNRVFTGGLALEAAQLLLVRAQAAGRGVDTFGDAERARQLALEVRDLRRQWAGPSEEAAFVAATAAGLMRDFEAAIRLAVEPPEGEATEREARHEGLLAVAADAALALGMTDRARQLAQLIRDETERLLIEADALTADGSRGQEVTDLLGTALETATTSEQRFRAYMGLAKARVWPLEGLERLEREDRDAAETVRATAEIAAGDIERGTRRLRSLRSPRAAALMVNAYVDADRIDDAVASLREAADRFNRAHFHLQSALLLASVGRLEEAFEEAVSTISTVPAGNFLHRHLRHLSLELAARLRDWTAMVEHARAALSEGTPYESRVVWALIGGLFNLRDRDAARRAFWEARPTPRDEEEARLAIELLRTGPPNPHSVNWVLDIADSFSGSEVLTAHAWTAVMEMSRGLDLPGAVASRLRQLTEGFFERWPESEIITRLDVSDPAELVVYLREHLAPGAAALQELVTDVLLARMPYGMLAVARSRPLGELLITQALGCLPIGSTDPPSMEAELRVATGALDHAVVADAHALYVIGKVGIDARRLTSSLARLLVPRSTLDDLLATADALRLESTTTMGWDPHNERPVLIEIDQDLAIHWHHEADALVDQVRACHLREDAEGAADDLRAAPILAPLELARREQVPLWTDDPAMRQLARNEGVQTFGTVSLLLALRETGDLDDADIDRAWAAMVRAKFVDVPFKPEVVLQVAADDGWRPDAAAYSISRPAVWADPEPVLGVYRRCVRGAAATAGAHLADWCYAAAIGAGRAVQPHLRQGAIATLVLSGFFHAGSDAEVLKNLLDGARTASSMLDLDDPLPVVAQLLRDALIDEAGPELAPRLFAHITSALRRDDRMTALNELLRPSR